MIPFDVPGWAIGDALDLARQLPDDSIDCIVTSPPYWGLRSYLPEDHPDKGKEMGAEPTLAEYVAGMVGLFQELRRALKPSGTCWLNLGDTYFGGGGFSPESPSNKAGSKQTTQKGALSSSWTSGQGLKPKDLCLVPYRVALALQADGWWLRDNIVWHKPNPMPSSVTDRCTSAHETVFLLTKSARYWFDQDAIREAQARPYSATVYRTRNVGGRSDGFTTPGGADGAGCPDGGRNKRNVWTIATKPYSGSHYAVMPPALVEPCVKAGCPAKVCAECGKGWGRVVERTSMVIRPGKKDTRSQNRTATSGTMISPPTSKTVGWKAGCNCDAGTTGGIVLDPFGGSGTVAEVAESLGRKWLMFDLDERNVELMKKRTAQRSLLGLMGGEG